MRNIRTLTLGSLVAVGGFLGEALMWHGGKAPVSCNVATRAERLSGSVKEICWSGEASIWFSYAASLPDLLLRRTAS